MLVSVYNEVKFARLTPLISVTACLENLEMSDIPTCKMRLLMRKLKTLVDGLGSAGL